MTAETLSGPGMVTRMSARRAVIAVAVLISLSISTREALALFSLFWFQFILGAVVPESAHGDELVVVAILYLGRAAWLFIRGRRRLPVLRRDGLREPYAELQKEREPA